METSAKISQTFILNATKPTKQPNTKDNNTLKKIVEGHSIIADF